MNIKQTIHTSETADLYVIDCFDSAHKLVEGAINTGEFNKVKLLDHSSYEQLPSKMRIVRYVQIAKKYLLYKRDINKYFGGRLPVYDDIYHAAPVSIVNLALIDVYKRNKKLRIHLFEDGIWNYTPRIFELYNINSGFVNMLVKFLGLKRVHEICDDMLILRPELFTGNTNVPIRKIPFINYENKEVRTAINKFCNYNDIDPIAEKIILLDQPMNEICFGFEEKIRDILNEVLKGDFFVKLHRRSNSEYYKKYNTYKDKLIPWEAICLNQETEDKILISYASTALLTAKFLLDKEPILIFLFKIDVIENIFQLKSDVIEFFERFKKTYRNQSRIFMPRTVEQLKAYLNELNVH